MKPRMPAFIFCLLAGAVLLSGAGVRGDTKGNEASFQTELQAEDARVKLSDGINNPDEIEEALKMQLRDQEQEWRLTTDFDSASQSGKIKEESIRTVGADKSRKQSRYPTINVFFNTLLMALASGLGAVPFFFVRTLSKRLVGLANAVACGVMLACSFDLIHEGEPYGPMLVVLGIMLGMLFVNVSEKYLSQYEDVTFESLKGAGARKTLLVVGIMAAHAIGEGSGVGVAYAGGRGWSQGVLVTLAIGLHNIPEGLAVATVMVSRGVAVKQAVFWAILTSLPQTLVAVPSYLFVEAFTACLPIAMGFAAGSMIWVVFSELMPDALEDLDHGSVATATTLSAAGLEGLRMLLAKLETDGGSLSSPIQADPRIIIPLLLALLPVAVICSSLCYMAKMTMSPRPGVLGASVGIQAGLAVICIAREMITGTGGLVTSLLLAGCGAAVSAAACSSFFSGSSTKEGKGEDGSSSKSKPQVQLMKDPLDLSGDLPTTWPPVVGLGKSTPVVWLSLAMVTMFSLVEGLQLASAMIPNVDHMDRVTMPGSLQGVCLGIMSGLSISLWPMNRKTAMVISGLLGCMTAIVAFGSLVVIPFGYPSGLMPQFDPDGHIGKVSCFVGGAVLAANKIHIWPAVKASIPGGPKLGLVLGGLIPVMAHGTLSAMCLATPYCLNLQ